MASRGELAVCAANNICTGQPCNLTASIDRNNPHLLLLTITIPNRLSHSHWTCLSLQNAAGGNTTMITTNTIINMPNKTLPDIPVPKDKIDAAISIPLKLGMVKNGSQPDGVINVAYKEEWTGVWKGWCCCTSHTVLVVHGTHSFSLSRQKSTAK